jgi:hypothetical protein
VGEYQPRKGKKRVPDGEPVTGYFPSVVTEAEYFAARAGAAERGIKRGRLGKTCINLFAGLLKNAREGDSYYMTMRTQRKGPPRYHVLINTNCEQGRSPCYAFPYVAFERAVLGELAEIDPREIVGGDQGDYEVAALSGELATVEAQIAALEAELLEGDIPSIARTLRNREERKRELVTALAEARSKAAHPLAESWGECQSLLAALDGAPDPEDARLRLRSVLRRVISEAWMLVVPRRLIRLVALQIYFAESGHRDYFIYYKQAHAGYGGRKEPELWVRSLATAGVPDDLNLSKRADAKRLEAALLALDLTDARE